MRVRGVNYDTGFISAGTTTREPFDPRVVKRETQIIRDDLHCNAVRVTGGYPERLEIAATYAAEAGLEVWFCPFTHNLTSEELLKLLADFAERAERLRQRGAEVVFLTGSELSLMTAGILPGDRLEDRAALLAEPHQLRLLIPGIRASMKELLGKAVEVARARFGGKLSYASVPLDGVDWGPFDFISTDAGYRTVERAARFRDESARLSPMAGRRGNRSRSPSSGAPPTGARPIWPAVGISLNGAMEPGRSGSRANTCATRTSRPGTLWNCWTSLKRRALTTCSCTRSRVTTWRIAVH